MLSLHVFASCEGNIRVAQMQILFPEHNLNNCINRQSSSSVIFTVAKTLCSIQNRHHGTGQQSYILSTSGHLKPHLIR